MNATSLLRTGVDALQGRILFGRPMRIRPLAPGPHAGSYRITAHRLQRPDGAVLEGWSSTPATESSRGLALYFGGRNENVAWAPHMASFLPAHTVYAFNYRGFGGSTGWPSQRHAQADALAVHDYVAAREHHRLPLALMGRSLGTVIALAVAHEAAAAQLVLLSPFESVRQVLRARPLGSALAPWIGKRFDCTALAQGCSGRTLTLLAEHDRAIPHGQSLRLCARLPRPPRIEIVAGTTHRTLPRSAGAQAVIAEFIWQAA